MSKRVWKNLESKILIMMFFAGVLLSASIYYSNFTQHYSLTIKNLQQNAINVHKYAENVIDVCSFMEINSIEDEDSELYLTTQQQLDEIRRIANILYLYTIKLNEDNKFIYVVDALDKDDEMFSHAGYLVEEEFLAMLRRCMNDEIVFGDRIMDTGYGILYPVFFPFHDSEGNVIGIIGIDFDCGELYNSMNRTRLMTIMLTIIIVFGFTFIMFLILKKVVKHTETIFARIEKEKYDENSSMLEEIGYRSKLLNISNELALLLHESDINSFENALKQGMNALLRLIKVDSINLWKNRMEGGELHCSQIFDYSTVKSVYSNDVLYKYDDFMSEWKETLAKGIRISGKVRDMSPKTRENFNSTGLLSALIIPIFIEEQFWGFVCFDDYQKERVFTKDEETILNSVTLMMASSFLRNRMIRKINDNTIELKIALEAAEQSNRAKGIFLAQMSHEIRTPMNAILGITEIHLRNSILSEDVEDGFIRIYESGSLLLNIINDILDFSKIDAGKLEIVQEKYDVPSLINDIMQLNRLRYDSKPIEFVLSVDENMPAELIGDEFRIKQVLNNLLSNAFKYTEKGEVKMSVSAEETEDDSETVMFNLQISDTGQGMNESQLSRLFDAYSRFNVNNNRNISGTGLGMNITKRLINLMKGEITVKSEVDKGTLFVVSLPQKKSCTKICGAEVINKLKTFNYHNKIIPKMTKIAHNKMPNGKILVVDDVKTNLFVAQGLMLPYGLHIDTADNGFEAIEKIKNGGDYDIIFMDHMMPKMDGISATKIIRDMGYARPIVAFTANAVLGQAEMFLANGFDGFIAKPIDSCELDQLLTKYIKSKKSPDESEVIDNAGNFTANSVDFASVEKLFILDAENAINILKELSSNLNNLNNEELESYIITVHGIKSALASIGEKEFSDAAFKLEKAGGEKNFNYIVNETPLFINSLSSIIEKYKPAETGDTSDNSAEISGEDRIFLCQILEEIKTYCKNYNIKDAKKALADLMKKMWPPRINDICNEISVGLLRGEFKKVISIIEKSLIYISSNTEN